MTRTHVVLGGNGVAGRETVRALLGRGEQVVSVGRRPSTVEGAVSLVADLLRPDEVVRALAGADVAYLTAGLPYSARRWTEQWPVLATNVVDAAVEHGTHLVHLDNVYAYGPVETPMTEDAPLRPSSAKGRARAAVLRLFDEARTERGLVVTVGRSADFYGPGAATSAFNAFTIDRVAAGRPVTWFFDADQPHSLTYTPDIGAALAVLGTDSVARDRTWHLPTAPALTGRQYAEHAAGAGARVKVMSGATMRVGALFSAAARETLEMRYLYTRPSVLESDAFESAFGTVPTSIEDGIAATLADARRTR